MVALIGSGSSAHWLAGKAGPTRETRHPLIADPSDDPSLINQAFAIPFLTKLVQLLFSLVRPRSLVLPCIIPRGRFHLTTTNMTITNGSDPSLWRQHLDALPTGGRIPSFFFAHGCTTLTYMD